MQKDGRDGAGVRLKALLAAALAAAIAIGLLLPVPHQMKTEPKSQFVTLEIGPR